MAREETRPERPFPDESRTALGRRGEDYVLRALRARGYRVEAQNLRIDGVEIDLVARCGRDYAIVEVKTARAACAPETMLTSSQRRRLCRAAKALATSLGARDRVHILVAALSVNRDQNSELRFFRVLGSVDNP